MALIHIKNFLPSVAKRESVRVLGLDPTRCGVGYAFLEGEHTLADWGVAGTKDCSDTAILSRARDIIDRCRPDIVAVEDSRDTRRKDRAKRLIAGVEHLARRRNITIIRVSRAQVRERFSPAWKKQEIAEVLARIFPNELGPRLTKVRKNWEPEAERMNIFDAVSFAVTAQSQ